MNAEDQPAASDASEQTVSRVEDTEQSILRSSTTKDEQTAQPGTLAALIMEQAREEGTDDPKPEDQPVSEEQPQVEDTPPPSTEDEPVTEPAAEETPKEPDPEEHKSIQEQIDDAKRKGEKPAWYLRRIAEESQKKRDALEDAGTVRLDLEKVRQEKQQLEAQVMALSGPQPTKDDPVVDVNDIQRLDTLQKNYRRFLNETEDAKPVTNDEGIDIYEGVLIGVNQDGTPKRSDLTGKQFRDLRREARAAIDEHIPERRTLLQQRAIEDEKVMKDYPELMDKKNVDLRTIVAFLGQEVMAGRAQKSPMLSRWIVRAAKMALQEQQQNGSTAPAVTNANSKKIMQSVQQPVAPTPTRMRSVPVRRGADEANAQKKFEKTGSAEDADELIEARLFSRSASAERLEPIGE